jgi:hypothetical protein
MNVGSMFPSRFLRAADLPDGQFVPVILDRVELTVVSEQTGEECPVLFFKGKSKGLVLNKTNANAIANSYGPESDAWAGLPVTLYRASTMFQGRSVECIRVKIPGQSPKPSPTNPPARPATNLPPSTPQRSGGAYLPAQPAGVVPVATEAGATDALVEDDGIAEADIPF